MRSFCRTALCLTPLSFLSDKIDRLRRPRETRNSLSERSQISPLIFGDRRVSFTRAAPLHLANTPGRAVCAAPTLSLPPPLPPQHPALLPHHTATKKFTPASHHAPTSPHRSSLALTPLSNAPTPPTPSAPRPIPWPTKKPTAAPIAAALTAAPISAPTAAPVNRRRKAPPATREPRQRLLSKTA
jgi:hypothetical protein